MKMKLSTITLTKHERTLLANLSEAPKGKVLVSNVRFALYAIARALNTRANARPYPLK